MEFNYEKVSLAEAKKILDGPDQEGGQPSSSKRRGQVTKENLLPDTLKWMAGLPHKARPFNLARHYPRIANAVFRSWQQPLRCKRYLEELIIDQTGRRRQGFPPQMASEIAALASYLAEQHPVAR